MELIIRSVVGCQICIMHIIHALYRRHSFDGLPCCRSAEQRACAVGDIGSSVSSVRARGPSYEGDGVLAAVVRPRLMQMEVALRHDRQWHAHMLPATHASLDT